MHVDHIRTTLRSWSYNDHLIGLIAAPWKIPRAAERLSAALQTEGKVQVEIRAREVRVIAPDPVNPFEFHVPVAAFLTVLGFQHWVTELGRTAALGSHRDVDIQQ